MKNSDISEEANAARRKAADRLDRDGRRSPDAVRRRVLALVQERNLAPAEFAKLLHKRLSASHAVDFCDKYKVSLDWLLSGDLQGLHRMTKEAKAAPPELSEAERKEVTRLFVALDPNGKEIALVCMRSLVKGSKPNG
jgi:hypothetical protein